MTSFILDGTTLPFPKVDLVPLGSAPANKYSIASDWNTVCQASIDMQTFLRGNFLLFMNGDPSTRAGLILSNGAPVVNANKGSLALDITTPAVYQNQDGAASWSPIGGGGGGMAIGSPVTGGTVGSLLFVGASTFLQQDNANFFVDNTSKRIGIGTAAPGTTLDLASATTTAGLAMRAGSTTGLSVASTGRIRYNEGTSKFQASLNGAAYVDFVTGTAFTLDIGDAIGSSTVGSLLFVGAGNVLQQDNANFFWDDTNNTLGVGTNSPTGSSMSTDLIARFTRVGTASHSFILIESGTAPADAGLALFTATGGGDFAVFLDESDARKVKFATTVVDNDTTRNTNTKLTLQQDGKFGIGTTAPTQLLDIASVFTFDTTAKVMTILQSAADPANGTGAITLRNTLNTSLVQIAFQDNTGTFKTAVGYNNSGGGAMFWYMPAGVNWNIATNGADTHQFKSNGDVGIGITAPLYRLDVHNAGASQIHIATGAVDSGGYLTSTVASQLYLSGGLGFDGTNLRAKATSASVVEMINGAISFQCLSGLTIGAITAMTERMLLHVAGGLEIFNSDAATLSAANRGKIRYNTGGQKFQVSTNGGGYVDLAVGSGMSIGGTITSATAGSVLFAGAAGILQQDNANFFWDDTNNRLGIGTTVPVDFIHVKASGPALNCFRAENTHATGFSSYIMINSAGTFEGGMYWGNATVASAHLQNRMFFFSNASDWDFANATQREVTIGMTTGGTFLQMQTGGGAAVSDANTGRIRYNTFGQTFQVSHNGGAYVSLATGTPWLPTVERLAADGAASPTIDTTYVSGAGTDLTLANGSLDGFIKNFVIISGTGTITPANLADGNVLTWSAAPANVSFVWNSIDATWHVIGSPYNMVTT